MSDALSTVVVHQSESITVTLVNQGSLSTNGSTPGTGTGSPDATYEHAQMSASAIWTINHNLGKYPSVTVVDSGGSEVDGFVNHISRTQAVVTFSLPFSGTAFCN
jgi:hypothetical protein